MLSAIQIAPSAASRPCTSTRPAAVATVLVIGIGFALHRPLMRLPESHLKYAVGVVLSSFGVFFLGEGLGVAWPGADAALLYSAATLLVVSQAQVASLSRQPVPA